MARSLVASVVRSGAFARFVALLERVVPPEPGRLSVLTYHRVDEPERERLLYPGLVSATPPEFEAQMRHVASRYRPVSLAEVLAVRYGDAELPPHAVLVTIDDAYRDFAEHAWPTLRELGVPAVLFVPTAFPDRPGAAFWWDVLWAALAAAPPGMPVATPAGPRRLESDAARLDVFRSVRDGLKRLPDEGLQSEVKCVTDALDGPPPPASVLGWDDLRALAGEGVVLAPHSRTHVLLDRVSRERAREELAGSLADLEREVGAVPRAVAYPSGAHDDGVVAVAAEEGFELGFTTTRGANDVCRADWLRLRRVNVGRRLGTAAVRAQLLPWWGRRRPRGR